MCMPWGRNTDPVKARRLGGRLKIEVNLYVNFVMKGGKVYKDQPDLMAENKLPG